MARAVAARFAAAGAAVPAPQAAFYVYPDFTPLAGLLMRRHGISSDEGLADLLLGGTASGCCRAARSARPAGGCGCGWQPPALRRNRAERDVALTAADPCSLPWIAAALGRLEEVLTDLTG